MHRLIMDAPEGFDVDHINGDQLDNRRSNLRICKHHENCRNTRSKGFGASSFKGVCWNKPQKKWVAKIRVHPRRICIGYFNDEMEAAWAYDMYSYKYHGEFAQLQFKPVNVPQRVGTSFSTELSGK